MLEGFSDNPRHQEKKAEAQKKNFQVKNFISQ